MATLADIRTKVRRLTGRPSTQQITDPEIDSYINSFYLYDLPEQLRLFSLQTTFEFLTISNTAQYDLRNMNITDNGITEAVVDVYVDLQPPVYIAGYQSSWSQSNEQFFRIYPELAEIETTVVGDGTPGPYTFTLSNSPILRGEVTVGAIDDTGGTVQLVDSPQTRISGNWIIINTETAVTGTVSYLTATGTVTFANNIPTGNEITVTAVPYAANRPQAMLYFDNIITLRPVPDRVYKVSMNAYKTPTRFLSDAPAVTPELKQWWQFLSYGAAKKIFEDSQDPEGVNTIMAGFKEQEKFVLRRTINQISNQRTSTIYSEQTSYPYNNNQGSF